MSEPDTAQTKLENIPGHVAMIMDGNGRWAKKRGLPRVAGHREGMRSVKEIVKEADRLGVKVLTLYAFSTENWRRPRPEVSALMALLKGYLKSELAELDEKKVRIRTIGDKGMLPADVRKVLDHAIRQTSGNSGLILNLALSYGGRGEIVRAARELARKCVEGVIHTDDISEELFAAHLDTTDLPDPDYLIRTGGEHRLSNFLLWQVSYAEFYVTDISWPDFRASQFREALLSFQYRERRFGRTGEQVKDT